jgi:hypothetical protein
LIFFLLIHPGDSLIKSEGGNQKRKTWAYQNRTSRVRTQPGKGAGEERGRDRDICMCCCPLFIVLRMIPFRFVALLPS